MMEKTIHSIMRMIKYLSRFLFFLIFNICPKKRLWRNNILNNLTVSKINYSDFAKQIVVMIQWIHVWVIQCVCALFMYYYIHTHTHARARVCVCNCWHIFFWKFIYVIIHTVYRNNYAWCIFFPIYFQGKKCLANYNILNV